MNQDINPSHLRTEPMPSAARGGVRLEILKTGPLAEKAKIDAGNLATLSNDYLILKIFNLSNPIVVNKASCQTPAVPVAMGDDYQLKDFEKSRSSTAHWTPPTRSMPSAPLAPISRSPGRRRITACPPAP